MKTNDTKNADETCWYTNRRFRKNIFILLAFILVYQSITSIILRDNDFLWHYKHGVYFIEGDLLNHPGLPNTIGRLMMDAILGTQNYYSARTLSFLLALAALVSSLKMWNRMANEKMRVSDPIAFASSVFSLALLIHFVLRDLDDCGLQIFLLFFLTSALYALNSGRSILCGFWLGLATTYKVSPLLFLPYLILKRKWIPALWMAIFIIILNLAPAFFIGWGQTIDRNLKWLERSRLDLTVEDPSHPTSSEEPRHQNQSLPFAIARYLQTYQPDHPLYIDHPLFIQFGSMENRSANYAVKGVLLLLGGLFAWRFRRPWVNNAKSDNFIREWSAVMLLTALLSPLNWIYHYVLALPAVFIIIRYYLQTQDIPQWRLIIMAAVAFKILLLHRFFLGRELSIIMLSYKFDAFAMLLVVMLVLTLTTDSMPAVQDEKKIEQ